MSPEDKRQGDLSIEAGVIEAARLQSALGPQRNEVPPPLPARPATRPPPSLAPGDLLAEPTLAGELVPDEEEEPFWGPPAATPPLATEAGLIDLLERAGRGEDLGLRPAQLLSAMVKVLVRRGLVTHAELMDELERAGTQDRQWSAPGVTRAKGAISASNEVPSSRRMR